MAVYTLRTHSPTSLIIQPESFKLTLQTYQYVYKMHIKFYILTLKYVKIQLNEVY